MITRTFAIGSCASALILCLNVAPIAHASGGSPTAKIVRSSSGLTFDGATLNADPHSGLIRKAVKTKAGQYNYVASAADTPGDPLPELTLAASNQGVQLSWDVVEGAKKYEVYRDGQFLVKTKDTNWVDTGATPGRSASYTVETTTPIKPVFQG